MKKEEASSLSPVLFWAGLLIVLVFCLQGFPLRDPGVVSVVLGLFYLALPAIGFLTAEKIEKDDFYVAIFFYAFGLWVVYEAFRPWMEPFFYLPSARLFFDGL